MVYHENIILTYYYKTSTASYGQSLHFVRVVLSFFWLILYGNSMNQVRSYGIDYFLSFLKWIALPTIATQNRR
jgi:hypothetical protein